MAENRRISFSDEQLKTITEKAEKVGMNVSEYVRKIAVEGQVVTVDLSQLLAHEESISGMIGEIKMFSSQKHESRWLYEADLQRIEDKLNELIERTDLRDFACIYIPHDNTKENHAHISLCPYSVDGSKKFLMNKKSLYELRRQMDRICVERGYSIVEAPELWADRAYRDWFFQVKEEGKIKIHPPKEEQMKGRHKRARKYKAHKEQEAQKEQDRLAFYKEVTKGYSKETANYFYQHPWFTSPRNADRPLRLRRITKDGTVRTELEHLALEHDEEAGDSG